MPTYRYYTIDPRARTPVMDLPLYGTYMDKVLNGNGNFTGTFRLGTGVFRDDLLLNATHPGRYGLVCKRDDVFVWAGILWSRTYGSDANTVQLTAQTYESIFDRMPFFGADFAYNALEQVTLMQNFVYRISHVDGTTYFANYDFGFTVPTVSATGITRTVAYDKRKMPLMSEFLKWISEVEGGVSYTINPVGVDTDTPTLEFQILPDTAITTSDIYLDYPGSVAKWWYNENAARAGTMHGATTTTPDGTPVATYTFNLDLVGAPGVGYPYWWEVQSYSDVFTYLELSGKADKQSTKLHMPLANPTFELSPSSKFNGWNKLGQNLSVRVQDPRFPDGQLFTKRLRGWSLSPESGDQPELVRIQLEGEEL